MPMLSHILTIILILPLVAIALAERGRKVLKLTSTFTEAESAKVTQSLFEIFRFPLSSYAERSAIDHLREQLSYWFACHNQRNPRVCKLFAQFDPGPQVLTVIVDNEDGKFMDGLILKAASNNCLVKSELKLRALNGYQRVAETSILQHKG